ncbi:hypothetical protein BH10ACT10_BH10ACT10_00690 [soil metagenome]
MMVGAMYGEGFAVLASLAGSHGDGTSRRRHRLGRRDVRHQLLRGSPLAAVIFNSGDQTTNMTELVGGGTFLV